MVPVLATFSEVHLILLLIIVFLLFGGKKLPELARGIGEAMKEFKKASRDLHDDAPAAPQKTETPAPSATTQPASNPPKQS